MIEFKSNIDSIISRMTHKTEMIKAAERTLQERISTEIAQSVEKIFQTSVIDSAVDNRPTEEHLANVQVSVTYNGDWNVIIANGTDAVWAEFGAGVYWNGPAGNSPNPLGDELHYWIGFYDGRGDSKGNRSAWAYRSADNTEWIVTHGTDATMPFYNTLLKLIYQGNRIIEIWNEVKPKW